MSSALSSQRLNGDNSLSVPAMSNLDEKKKQKCCQIRVIARIRPLTEDEEKAKSQISIFPITVTKESNKSPMESSKNWENLLSRIPLERRRANTTSRLLSSARTFPTRHSESGLDARRNLARQKKQGYSTSLLAGTENRRRFDFDAVLGQEATQEEVYTRSIGDNTIRRNILRGINTTIIAIGQDGSGKSYTMSGGTRSKKNECSNLTVAEDGGILPRAIRDLFNTKQRHSFSATVCITMSFIEFSVEGMRDLLVESDSALLHQTSQCEGADLKDIEELTSWVQVNSSAEVKKIMDQASKHRAKNGEKSARCHLLCSFNTTIKPHGTKNNGNPSHSQQQASMKLKLLNLAAPKSPRDFMGTNHGIHCLEQILQSHTGNKRSKVQSQDLTCVLSKTLDDTLRGKMGTLRNDFETIAKNDLTSFSFSFLGKSFTVMIACVSPANSKMESTLDLFRLAEAARNVVKKNVEKRKVMTSGVCSTVRAENSRLKEKLCRLNRRNNEEENEESCKTQARNNELIFSRRKSTTAKVCSICLYRKLSEYYLKPRRFSFSLPYLFQASESTFNSSLAPCQEPLMPESKTGGLPDTKPSEQKTEANSESRVQNLIERVAELEGLYRKEKTISEQTLQENEHLKSELVPMKNLLNDLRGKFSTLEEELSGVSKQLVEEQKVTEELESLRESFRKRVWLQDERIRIQTEELDETMEAKEKIEMELDGAKFILSGERQLRDQAHDLIGAIEKNYAALSVEHSVYKVEVGYGNQQVKWLRKKPQDPNENTPSTFEVNADSDSTKDSFVSKEAVLKSLQMISSPASTYEPNTDSVSSKDSPSSQGRVLKSLQMISSPASTYEPNADSVSSKDSPASQGRVLKSLQMISSPALIYKPSENDDDPVSIKPLQVDNISFCDQIQTKGDTMTSSRDNTFHQDKVSPTSIESWNGSSDCSESRLDASKNTFLDNNEDAKYNESSVDQVFHPQRNVTNLSESSNDPPVGLDITTTTEEDSRATKDDVVTSDIGEVDGSMVPCSCQSPFFSTGKIKHVDFYLPRLGLSCMCGKQQFTPGANGEKDVCDLRNILRPWQEEFLASVGINRAQDFVKVYNEKGKESKVGKITTFQKNGLAKTMRQWRKHNELPPMKTASCALALLIWGKTCESVLRSFDTQR